MRIAKNNRTKLPAGWVHFQERLLTSALHRLDALIVLSLLILLVLELIYLRGWTYPIIGDRTLQIYPAQEIARGRLPYIDFSYNHPPFPLMLAALPMWIFPSLSVGKGPAWVHQALTFIWACGGIVGVYFIGKQLMNNRVGGALAGWLLVGLTPLLVLEAAEGENSILVVSAVVLAVALMQHDRWLWAGIATGIGAMTSYPALLAMAGAWVLFAQYQGRDRWRRIGLFLVGVAAPVAITAGWLAARRSLGPAISETMRWPVAYALGLGEELVGKKASLHIAGLGKMVRDLALAYYGKGGWILVAATFGLGAFVVNGLKRGQRDALWKNPATVPPLILCILTMIYLFVESGELDSFLVLPFVAVWAAFGFKSAIHIAGTWRTWLARTLAVLIIIISVFFSGLMTASAQKRIATSKTTNVGQVSLQTQVDATQALEKYLSPGQGLQVMDELWPLVLSGRENVSPFFHTGPKIELAARLSGDAPKGIFWQVIDDSPDVVMFSLKERNADYDRLAKMLTNHGKVCAGVVHRLAVFVPSDNVQTLAAVVAMQQALDGKIPKPKELEPEEIKSMKSVAIREVSPGLLLIASRVTRAKRELVLHLTWWTWLAKRDQPSIWLEIVSDQQTQRWQLMPPALTQDAVTRQNIDLREFGLKSIPEGATLQLTASGKFSTHPCLAPVITDPIILKVP